MWKCIQHHGLYFVNLITMGSLAWYEAIRGKRFVNKYFLFALNLRVLINTIPLVLLILMKVIVRDNINKQTASANEN